MQLQDLHAMPGHLIRRAQQIAVAIFMEECAEFDLTPVQYAALAAIRENPGTDATRLSALIAFDRSTLGSVLERLEARKLVTRYSSRKTSGSSFSSLPARAKRWSSARKRRYCARRSASSRRCGQRTEPS